MASISDMSLWCLEIPAGGTTCVYQIEQKPRSLQVVHVTNAALPGPNAASGQHYLTIKKAGKGHTDFTLCTLNKDSHPQHNLDFIIDETVEFKNHGKGPVHLAGYETFSFEPDSEDEDEEEEEDSEEAPQAVRLQQQPSRAAANGPWADQAGKMKANGIPQAGQQVTTDADSDDEDDDESGEGFPELNSDDFVGECEDDEDYEAGQDQGTSDGMEGSEPDVDEDEEGGSDEDEGSDDEDEDEQQEDDGEEGSSDEEQQTQQQLAKVGSKRPAPSPAASITGKKQPQQQPQQQQPMTPAPKKAKQAEQAKQAPASAPAKQQQGKQQEGKQTPSKGAPANEQEYQAAVVNWLRSQPNKSAPLAKIGTAVPKPSGISKLGPWVKSKADIFKVDANNQNVTLLK